MTPRDRIDLAIDHAAARMTHAQPSEALRANVMARIAVERPLRGWWRYALASGAIASVGLIAAIAWPTTSTVIAPESGMAIMTSATKEPAAVPTSIADDASPLSSINRASIARVERTASRPLAVFPMSKAERDWRARATPALEHPDPLEVQALELRTIDITPLGVAPLTVPALGEIQNR